MQVEMISSAQMLKRYIALGQELSIKDQFRMFLLPDAPEVIAQYIGLHQMDDFMVCLLLRRYETVFAQYMTRYRVSPRAERLMFEASDARELIDTYIAYHPLSSEAHVRLFDFDESADLIRKYIEHHGALSFAAQVRLLSHPKADVLIECCSLKHCLLPCIKEAAKKHA